MLGPDAEDAVREALRTTMTLTQQTIERGLGATLQAAESIARAVASGGKLLVFGNGGSAAEAQHFVAEFVGRFMRERRALPAIALTTDTSILTAIGNDYSFDRVFARQVEALGRAGDIALGISTSGRSPNVLEGLRAARQRGVTTIGMTGGDGGAMAALSDIHVNVAHAMTARIQEVQLMLLHAICDLVERALSSAPEAS